MYAVGDRHALPDRHARVIATQAVLRAASHLWVGAGDGAGAAAGACVLSSTAAVLEPHPQWRLGAWPGLRLLHGPALDGEEEGMKAWLLDQVMAHPPYDMGWLTHLNDDDKVRMTVWPCTIAPRTHHRRWH